MDFVNRLLIYLVGSTATVSHSNQNEKNGLGS
jgi:hypothetical protein